MRRHLRVAAIALTLASCAAPYAKVSPKKPHLTGPRGSGTLASVEQTLDQAIHEHRAQPLQAMGHCLDALESITGELRRDPANATAIRDYDFAIARVFQIIQEAKLDPWTKPLAVPGAKGEFILTHQPDPRPEWNPALYDFTPADEFDVGGKYVSERTTRDGIGSAIVAVQREPNKNAREHFAPSRIFYSVTVTAHFEGRKCVLKFEDPLASETVSFYGRTLPLAADFTVPLAVMLQQTDPKKHEISRVLDPEKFAHTAAIERLQSYDPNKTVVLVIHGLMDSQATWTPMINKLRGDPVIRKHYQFWFSTTISPCAFAFCARNLMLWKSASQK